jgi:hypothetical protein
MTALDERCHHESESKRRAVAVDAVVDAMLAV